MTELRTVSFGAGDPGLFSYPQVIHLLTVEFARARRYGYPLSCLLLRVDGLDALRDLHGYRVRDLVRERAVALVRRQSRSCDFLGRFPDDRLLVVLPHTDLEGALSLAERLRVALGNLESDVEVGQPFRASASIGVSCFRDRNTLFYDALVFAAEEALKEATSLGGNRAVARDPRAPAGEGT
ncbi:MAG TPA: GGDEF domain-containing protein [Planctomycetota bacterium]|jgi:diguanylate cyclase (GGDEF)-like protein|nr:GGDEF domain-containing protein [Planctomycetota bacterium]